MSYVLPIEVYGSQPSAAVGLAATGIPLLFVFRETPGKTL
jgi:hypothetical protein